jgi:phosphoglycolate phosphatase-like HAD superfamily hydrolase
MRTQEKRAAVFDLNHTLVDMDPVVTADILLGREFGLELTREEVHKHFGKRPDDFYRDLFGQDLPTEEMRRRLMRHQANHPRGPMPDVQRVLSVLRTNGILTGVFTSTSSELTQNLLREAGLPPEDFDLIHAEEDIAADVAGGRPPFSGVITRLGRLGVRPENTLFIGNEVSDTLAGAPSYVIVATDLFPEDRLIADGVPPERIIHGLGQVPGLFGLSG